MLTVTKTSSTKEVESNNPKKVIRLNCDWEIEKIVVHFIKSDSGNNSYRTFTGDYAELLFFRYVEELLESASVLVVIEMGRCGFEGPRLLEKLGAEVHLVPISRLQMISNKKRVKTDKLDAKFLSTLILKETPKVWIPERGQWSRRKLLECREHKLKEVNRANGRLRSFIALTPLRPEHINKKIKAKSWREKMTIWHRDCPDIFDEILWDEIFELIDLIEFNEASLEKTLKRMKELEDLDRQAAEANGEVYVLDKLRKLKGIGEHVARTFAWYIGDFKRFSNGKKISNYFGLAPTPHTSCKMSKELGISKCGKPMLRAMAVQLAWIWTRNQKDSRIFQKWAHKLTGRRSKKTSIIAMARQLIVAIYHYIVNDIEIEGVVYS
jgi:transposase